MFETMKSLLQKELILDNGALRKTSRMFVLTEEHGNLRIKVRILVVIWLPKLLRESTFKWKRLSSNA